MEELIKKAMEILKSREDYYGEQASYDDKSYEVRADALARAAAYNSAWWIVYYALHGDEDALNQFDYYPCRCKDCAYLRDDGVCDDCGRVAATVTDEDCSMNQKF